MEIEDTIMQLSTINKCVVVSKKDPHHLQGNIPVAFVVLKSNNTKTVIEELKSYCLHNIIDYAVPEEYYTIDTIPFTPNGKIDFTFLEEMAKTAISI